MSQPLAPSAAHTSLLAAGIFREYDIRGIAGETLHEEDARLIASAFAQKTLEENAEPAVCVGRDGRDSSPALAKAVCRGLAGCGVKVYDIGLVPTPALYFATKTLKTAGGIMVTGSHNPPKHNGFKFVLGAQSLYGAAIQELRKLALKGAFPQGKGSQEMRDVREEYVGVLAGAYEGSHDLKVAWDAGNGATGEVMTMLARRLPGKHTLLNERIDGTFPVHHPDPSEAKNLQQLIDTVRSQSLDCGIAFDGDGDRIGVVDDEGGIWWGDQLLMLYAREVLQDYPKATVIADIKASQVLFDEIRRLGGVPLMWKSGHSLIKAKMAETGAKLAGEMSGHMFFADQYYGYDDALYAAVRLLGLLSRSDKKLSDLRKGLPRAVNTPEMRFACADERKFAVIGEVKARLKAANASFSDIDGVRVSLKDGWWLLRASNTQGVLVARCEAADAAALARITADLRKQLSLSNVALPS